MKFKTTELIAEMDYLIAESGEKFKRLIAEGKMERDVALGHYNRLKAIRLAVKYFNFESIEIERKSNGKRLLRK